jgi:alpha-L-arabinofuranosidase
MILKRYSIIALAIVLGSSINIIAQKTLPIMVNVDSPKAEIRSTMWGIFFEDINFGADGGLYAELVKNRSFEFYKPRTGWKIDMASKDSNDLFLTSSA